VRDVVVIYLGAQFIVGIPLLALGGSESLLLVLVVLSPVVSLGIAVLWLRQRYGNELWLVRGRRRHRANDISFGLGIGLACFLGQRLIVLIIALILNSAGIEMPVVQETFHEIVERPFGAPLLVVTSVLLAPVAEEVIFRGVLFQGLRSRTGFWVAAVVSSALFTLAHLGEGGGWLASGIIVSGILPLGVVFAGLLERRGTLLVSIVAHATYNAIGVAALILTAGQI
jgi:membrane protease YdiL (CAAX protease family)